MDLRDEVLNVLNGLYTDDNILDEVIDEYVTIVTDADEIEDALNEIRNHIYGGCISGVIEPMITYHDTILFYERNIEWLSNHGSIDNDMAAWLVQDDYFILDDVTKNRISWFIWELNLINIVNELESEGLI